MSREGDTRGKDLYSRVVEAAARLAEHPTAATAYDWIVAREKFQRYAQNPGWRNRGDNLARLASDRRYCELVADLQRATTAMVDRRRELIGEGTT